MTTRFRVILPVRHLDLAMPRSGLAPDERVRMSYAFAADTLDAVRQCQSVHGIVVVSSDRRIAQLAVHNGAQFVLATPGMGLNAAIDHAYARTRSQSDQMVAAVVSDLPALRPSELEEVLVAAGRRHDTVYATALAGDGVTFQAEREATFRSCLAPAPNLRRTARGTEVKTLSPGLRCDVDTAEGLRIARYLGVGNATMRELTELGRAIPREVSLG